jgi:SPP1 family predicted phage head-tail adaptor
MIRAGSLDRRIAIEARTISRRQDGSEVIGWSSVGETWAQVTPLKGQERYNAGAEQPEYDFKIRIRWREGLSSGMRVVLDGRILDIKSVLEVGRREGLDLLCSGQQP